MRNSQVLAASSLSGHFSCGSPVKRRSATWTHGKNHCFQLLLRTSRPDMTIRNLLVRNKMGKAQSSAEKTPVHTRLCMVNINALKESANLWMSSWKETDIRNMELFPMYFDEETVKLPGSLAYLTTQPEETVQLQKIAVENGAPIVGFALLHLPEEYQFSPPQLDIKIDEEIRPIEGQFNIRPIALLGELKVPIYSKVTSCIPIQIIGRTKIKRIHQIHKGIRVEVELYRDVPDSMLSENDMEDALHESSTLSQQSVLSLLSFFAMEHHFDHVARYWRQIWRFQALEQTSAHKRLEFVIDALEVSQSSCYSQFADKSSLTKS
ncbi:hypothetical protein IE077_002504 [Cardiosporidium cionae]|uniref:Lon N-terminal domain-containing protein n=1 Tax=Cardiosporidium cionae TaxID=476202 RepID=A0ABQ7JBM1_9APIC|nr:hypothetical protein IE077_002504 [Cardiosporidium cionae]|eukprot:KAF8821065.1 hypothetical protein IE077_002504 [Cardiosporidium cionae]